VNPDGHSVYVTSLDSTSISQYDVGPGGALAPKSPPTVSNPSGSAGIAVSPDGHSVYVTNVTASGPSSVSQYNVGAGGALTPKSPATVPAGTIPTKLAVSPDGHDVYVVNSGDDDVAQYDVGPGGALSPKSPATVPVGDNPFGIAVRSTLGTPPPPPTIGDVIASVEALGLPGGIEGALLAKLTGAQQDLDANNNAGACGKLGAFVNQVEGQNAKQIPTDDAKALTDQATALSRSLGCGRG
jgi:hypothetical protein